MPDDSKRCLVVGVGNPDRGDDAAGREVARWLRGRLPPDVEVIEHNGEVASLLACLEGAAAVYLIDTCASGAPLGSVRRFDVGVRPLPHVAFSVSTHGLGLAEAIEFARTLGQIPSRCIVYAIEAGSFEPGAPPSPLVAAAVGHVGEQVQDEISRTRASG